MTIIGIGTDIVAVERIADLWQRFGEKFAKRILSEKEWPSFEGKQDKISFLAKRFAAKEAISKALGTGIGGEVSFHDLSVLNYPHGAPYVDYSPKGQSLIQSKGVSQTHISISDEKDHALAFIILT